MSEDRERDAGDTAGIRIDPVSAPWAWHGAAHWESSGDTHRPWRIPPDEFHDFDPPRLVERARMAAGVRLDIETDAVAVEVQIIPDRPCSPADILVDGVLDARIEPAGRAVLVRHELPPGDHRLEVWLPHFGDLRVGRVHLHGQTRAEPAPARTRWIAYGSSITQSRTSDGPSTAWPALVDRALEWTHTNLGMDGECHLDPPARRTLARSDSELIVACIGINMHGAASFGPRALAAQVGGFLCDLAAVDPERPVVLISPIPSPSREEAPNAVGLTLADVRNCIESVGRSLSERRPGITWIPGPELLSFSEAQRLLPDGLHPGQDAMDMIAARLAPRLRALLARAR